MAQEQERFGDLLKRHRTELGITQEALHHRSGVSVDAISMFERGIRSSPQPGTVKLLADGLGLRPGSKQREAFVAAVGRRPAPTPFREARAPELGLDGIPSPCRRFHGREMELAELRRRLEQDRHVTVHGRDGVGKTQLARRYVETHGADYPDGLFWLRAGGEAALVESLLGVSFRLGLPEWDQPDAERQIESVARWLRQHPRWLVVLDDLAPATAPAVRRWLPRGPMGHVLETASVPAWTMPHGGWDSSKAGGAGPASHAMELASLSPAEAVRYLLDSSQRTDVEAAHAVVRGLGGLPLALELAAAHVRASGCDLATYGRSLSVELGASGLEDDVRGVAAAVRLSVGRLARDHPAAAAILQLGAFLAGDDIPYALVRARIGDPPGALDDVQADAEKLDQAVALLQRYSLADRRRDSFGLHALVQPVVRTSLAPDEWRLWLAAAIRLLRAWLPDDPGGRPELWPVCARAVAHVEAADRAAAERTVEARALGQLLRQTASYLQARGQLGIARPLLERALAVQEAAFGPDDADTAEGLNQLALLLHEQGELAAARPVVRRAVALALGTTTLPPRVRAVLTSGIASMLGADVDRTYSSRAEALADMERDVRSAGLVRLLASRGSELQGETFERLLAKRTPETAVALRVLLPVTRGTADQTLWVRVRDAEMARFDRSFGGGMLAAQIETTIRFLRPYVEIGVVQLRLYNVPHVGRVLLTENVCYLTMYRADAHGRDSAMVKYRRGGSAYDWLSRCFDMVWESSLDPEAGPAEQSR